MSFGEVRSKPLKELSSLYLCNVSEKKLVLANGPASGARGKLGYASAIFCHLWRGVLTGSSNLDDCCKQGLAFGGLKQGHRVRGQRK